MLVAAAALGAGSRPLSGGVALELGITPSAPIGDFGPRAFAPSASGAPFIAVGVHAPRVLLDISSVAVAAASSGFRRPQLVICPGGGTAAVHEPMVTAARRCPASFPSPAATSFAVVTASFDHR